MDRLIESICVLNGHIRNPEYHQKRMDDSVFELSGSVNRLKLKDTISKLKIPGSGKFKLRILYSDRIEKTELIPYRPVVISSFQLIEGNGIEYPLKMEDRSVLEYLKSLTEADEIIIVKNGEITDTSFSNLLFTDGRKMLTPKKPLLKGVMRSCLLDRGEIEESEIRTTDLEKFKYFKIINALNSPDESHWFKISAIRK